MKLFDLSGRPVSRLITKYRIKWDEASRSKFQFRVKQLVKPIWFTHVVFEEFPVFGSLLKIDIFNATKRIAIEVNGSQHEKFNEFFHDGSPLKFVKEIKRDLQKYKWCQLNNIRLVEIVESDLKDLATFYKNLEG